MRHTTIALGLAMATTLYGNLAQAGVFADDLARCIVTSATPEDRALLAMHLFTTMSVSPALATLPAVPEAQRIDIADKAAAVYVRLITENCGRQTVSAIANEGPVAMQTAFSMLGQVSIRQLMMEPKVMQEMNRLSTTTKDKMEAFAKANGLPVAPPQR